jgi:hypothetical protein
VPVLTPHLVGMLSHLARDSPPGSGGGGGGLGLLDCYGIPPRPTAFGQAPPSTPAQAQSPKQPVLSWPLLHAVFSHVLDRGVGMGAAVDRGLGMHGRRSRGACMDPFADGG